MDDDHGHNLDHFSGSLGGLFEPGETIGSDYEIIELIGEGSDAEVYKVKNRVDGCFYAAKVPRDGNVSQGFEHESGMVGNLRKLPPSTHVVHVHPSIEHNGCPILILEFLDGPTLQERMDSGGKFSPEEANKLMLEILEGLSALHSARVIHRDLKPENIKLTSRGAVIFDLGVAQRRGAKSTPGVGTRGYTPPDSGANVQADIFAAGVIYHQLILGRMPVWEQGGSVPAGVNDSIVFPKGFGEYFGLRSILAKALSCGKRARYRSAAAMASEIRVGPHPFRVGRGARLLWDHNCTTAMKAVLAAAAVGVVALLVMFWPESQEREPLPDGFQLNLDYRETLLRDHSNRRDARRELARIAMLREEMRSPSGVDAKITRITLNLEEKKRKELKVVLVHRTPGGSEVRTDDLPFLPLKGPGSFVWEGEESIEGVNSNSVFLVEVKSDLAWPMGLVRQHSFSSDSLTSLQPGPHGQIPLEIDKGSASLEIEGHFVRK